jgi:hypothetical protein
MSTHYYPIESFPNYFITKTGKVFRKKYSLEKGTYFMEMKPILSKTSARTKSYQYFKLVNEDGKRSVVYLRTLYKGTFGENSINADAFILVNEKAKKEYELERKKKKQATKKRQAKIRKIEKQKNERLKDRVQRQLAKERKEREDYLSELNKLQKDLGF